MLDLTITNLYFLQDWFNNRRAEEVEKKLDILKKAGFSSASLDSLRRNTEEWQWKPFLCHLCETKSYGWKEDLDRHMKSCTGFNDHDTSEGSDEQVVKLAISGNNDETLEEVSQSEDVIPKEDHQNVEQKEPLDNVDAKDNKQDSQPTSSRSQGKDSNFEIGVFIGFFLGFVFLTVVLSVMGFSFAPVRLERKIFAEKIIMAKELLKDIEYPYKVNEVIHQVNAVLDYDFVKHGVMQNVQEEETVKAIFKHSRSMDKVMKVSCTDDHARIYVTGKCSKLNKPTDMVEKCKAFYEECQMV